MLRVVFYQPQIPPNTGNAIRLVACAPAELHLVEPLGFNLEDKQLRRAGLDYHDLARVFTHANLDDCFATLDAVTPQPARVFAFTSTATTVYSQVDYRPDDILLFGREADGLPADVLAHPRLTEHIRFPMLPGRRSLNLSNCAAIAVYEAWRQLGYAEQL